MKITQYSLIFALMAGALACATESSDPTLPEETTDPVDEGSIVARCEYRNVFSGQPECRDYTGSAWTGESAAEDCSTGIIGADFVFSPGEVCALEPILGICTVASEEGLDYTLYVGGVDEGMCISAELACVNFASGVFEAAGICIEDTDEDSHTVFIPPYQSCREPVEGEEPGMSDGEVCTLNTINGCTEEGRDFRDYGSCEVVETNRPYYSVTGRPPGRDDDPRLQDEDYMADLKWVRSQVESCACICCHSEQSREGPARWSVDGPDLWIDMMSDDAIGLFSGYIDSSAFGYYDPAENNGFNRRDSGMPTTDVTRMVTFFLEEFDRRNLRAEDMDDKPPVGGPLVEQMNYELPDCEEGEGVDENGELIWHGDDPARYVYILEEGSSNPGVPPNYDLPEGTIWRVDVAPEDPAIDSGFALGDVPQGGFQVYPEVGIAPESLVPGERYHLYVLFDVAMPVARCVFEAL